ncbi:GntR family transcriptional regulator [Rubrobacter taiwanensis]|uniref:GntR family transcriptional regulator n=1 Tax=Rubrobacter taiwanensis TaxID=185139 RepID=A0A4R1BFQ9_9ACTN|nr:GntR family transcriptional regulator [Rubrobacter taiwanensis]
MKHRIDFDSPIPYYYQLKRILAEEIEAGTYRPGDRLPGEHELCRTFGVSRTVVRQALGELEMEGLLQRRKGRGSFVAPKKVSESLFQNLTGLYEDVTARGGTLRSEVRRLERAAAPASVAAELGLEEGDPVIVLDRLRFVDGVPWVVVTTYLPYGLCPQLLEEDMSEQSLYAVLEQKYGIEISYGRRSVEAAAATPAVAEALGIEEGGLILLLRSTSYGVDDRPIEHFIAHHRGDLSRFEVTLVRRRGPGGAVLPGGVPNMIAATGREEAKE